MRHVWRLRDTKKRQIMTAVDGSNLHVTTQFRMMCPKKVRTSCNRQLNAGPSTERRAVSSTQGRQLKAGPSTQRRITNSTQCRQFNAGPSSQFKAVVSIEGRSLNTLPVNSTQGRQLSAAPSAQCGAVSSMQRRQLSAGAVCFNAGPSVSMQGCLLNAARFVCSTQKLLKARRHLNAVSCRLLHAGPVCSTQGPSAQRNASLLNARPSAQCRAVARPSAQGRAVSSMQGCSFQCRAVCFNAGLTQCKTITSMQGHQLNAGPTPQCSGVWLA